MSRAFAVVLAVVLCSCTRSSPEPDVPKPAPPPKQEPEPRLNDGSGKCDPMPKEGDPCAPGDGYCVVDWGEPGGHSTALWCRDGRWEIENEVNLAADEY